MGISHDGSMKLVYIYNMIFTYIWLMFLFGKLVCKYTVRHLNPSWLLRNSKIFNHLFGDFFFGIGLFLSKELQPVKHLRKTKKSSNFAMNPPLLWGVFHICVFGCSASGNSEKTFSGCSTR